MNGPSPVLPGQLLARLEQCRSGLSERFAAPFSLWTHNDDGFQPVDGSNQSPQTDRQQQALGKHLSDRFSRVEIQPGIHCHAVDCDRELVMHVMIISPGVRIVVAGLTALTRQSLVEQLADSAIGHVNGEVELQDARGCLAEYADQVTNDFEELAWLRALTEHIDITDLRTDLASVCEIILPTLRELINAECIALVRHSSDVDSELEFSFVSGELDLDVTTCTQLIKHADPQPGHPVVRNATRAWDLKPDAFGLRNYILVRVYRAGSDFGWLLVANRAMLGRTPDELRVNASCLSEWEFGTFEAGLVNAASVMLATHARNAELFREREDLMLGVVRALINAVDAKDAYTCGHSDRVASFAQRIARKMNLSNTECERIYMAGLLHDIGKIGIPDEVLCKAGKLTEEEFSVIKKHPEIGYSILRHVKQLKYVLPGVLHHHESFDGNGYPHGLAGDDIPLCGRVIAVADSFDAMTSTRSYRAAMGHEKAQQILRNGSGTQWDAKVVDAFFEALPEIEQVCDQQDVQKLTPGSADEYGRRVSEPWDALSAALTALENVYE